MACRKDDPLVERMSLQNKNFIIVTLQWKQGEKESHVSPGNISKHTNIKCEDI